MVSHVMAYMIASYMIASVGVVLGGLYDYSYEVGRQLAFIFGD